MSLTVYYLPNCGTCKKALKFLDANNIAYQAKHIVEETPSKEELKDLVEKSNLPINKFFNVSGTRYRELGLKDIVKTASDDKKLELLASDGMLIKRPIVTDGKKVTVGFNEELFNNNWK
jgi:arsenate reductase (glutaredoxin)